MIAYYDAPCCACGVEIRKGDNCDYDRQVKKLRHFNCGESFDVTDAAAIALADRLHYRPHAEVMKGRNDATD